MAAERSLPVVSPQDPIRLLGILAVADLLKARQWAREEEGKQKRFLGLRGLAGGAEPSGRTARGQSSSLLRKEPGRLGVAITGGILDFT